MLSAIKVIGACLIILTTVFGSIAVVLMLLSRIRNLFNILGGQTVPQRRPAKGWKGSLRDIEARNRPGRLLLSLSIVSAGVFYIQYVVIGLIAPGVISAAIVPIARRRGWGSEGRLTRHLSRPPFLDESRRAALHGTRFVG